jgi:hypothetical protein
MAFVLPHHVSVKLKENLKSAKLVFIVISRYQYTKKIEKVRWYIEPRAGWPPNLSL